MASYGEHLNKTLLSHEEWCSLLCPQGLRRETISCDGWERKGNNKTVLSTVNYTFN
jgi:hypothetical protein